MPTNPYTPPTAMVDDTHPRTGSERFNASGRSRPLSHSMKWITESWELYKRQPGMWILVLVMYFAVMFAALFVVGLAAGMTSAVSPTFAMIAPMVANIGFAIIGPALFVGFAVMADAVRRGQHIEIGMLFAGFQHRTRQLLLLGVLYLAMSAAFMIVAGIAGAVLGFAGTSGSLGLLLPFIIVIGVVVWLLFICATIFAPVLVYLNNCSPWEAIKASFSGSSKNLIPGLVCGIVFTVLMVLSAIPLLLGLLVTVPMAAILLYTSYRDIYIDAAA
jgi:uncharacterized membrane protein